MSAIQAALSELGTMDRDALMDRWGAVFGNPAPRRAKVPMLQRAIAWQLQMRASAQWRHPSEMQKLVRSLRPGRQSVTLDPGARLLREWKGVTHQVTVLPEGFEYEGIRYRSLSAIARKITGTPWSGPAFFGLRT